MSTEPLPVPGDAAFERLLAAALDGPAPGPVAAPRRRRQVTAAAAVAAATAAGRPPRRGQRVAGKRGRRPIAAVLVGAAASIAVVLATASAGLLPDSVQTKVADIAARIGLQLPGAGADRATGPAAAPPDDGSPSEGIAVAAPSDLGT